MKEMAVERWESFDNLEMNRNTNWQYSTVFCENKIMIWQTLLALVVRMTAVAEVSNWKKKGLVNRNGKIALNLQYVFSNTVF